MINSLENLEKKLGYAFDKKDLLKKALLKIWVIKESLIKWQNGNLIKGLKNWYIDDQFEFAIKHFQWCI